MMEDEVLFQEIGQFQNMKSNLSTSQINPSMKSRSRRRRLKKKSKFKEGSLNPTENEEIVKKGSLDALSEWPAHVSPISQSCIVGREQRESTVVRIEGPASLLVDGLPTFPLTEKKRASTSILVRRSYNLRPRLGF